MYGIIESIIDHAWISTNTGAQQYIMYICGALIVVFSVAFVDAIKNLVSAYAPKRKE